MSKDLVPKSGKSSDQKSGFAQTCNLLSQYVRERRSLGHDHIGGVGKTAPNGSPVTLDLLSSMGNSGEDTTVSGSATRTAKPVEPENAPMTIFYGGKVCVVNNISADKAREVMELAVMGSRSSTISGSDSTINIVNKANDASGLGTNLMMTATPLPHVQVPSSSLHKFFEKRKERIASKAPYMLPPKQ